MPTQTQPVSTLDLPGLPLFKTGKVRNVYDFGDTLLLVSTDRVSAFDFILNQPIPHKGAVLTGISEFWFKRFQNLVANQFISTDVNDFPAITKPYHEVLRGRSMLVKKTELLPIECIVRGYIIGSGWKEYEKTGMVCGIPLPNKLKMADRLPEPIFTPSKKAESGHDENISYDEMVKIVGPAISEKLKTISLSIYKEAADYALTKGIIIADTKFEFGLLKDEIIWIDEALTPDSSRFWPKDTYAPGKSPKSLDKQIIRDYLESTNWDKNPPIPDLPNAIIAKLSQAYQDIQRQLTA